MTEENNRWREQSVRNRLRILSAARHRIAAQPATFSSAISPLLARTLADTLAAEVLPLLAAMRFLEREAEAILKPRQCSAKGRPIWLFGIRSEVTRSPFGTVLIIAPSNYPLMLAGIQASQALVAGNAVIWKPGRGGRAVAELFAEAMYAAGLPRDLLRVTDESIETVDVELARGVDKVFFTGSAVVGRLLLQKLALTLTPSVMELSGCDAVIVLPDADLAYVAKAIAFGMRLNGSATCMAPRRVLLVDASLARQQEITSALLPAFSAIKGISLPESIKQQLGALLVNAREAGATVHGDADVEAFKPLLLTQGQSTMQIAQADLFAPVVTIIPVEGEHGVFAAQECCAFGLTAAIFGNETRARRIAERLDVGTVLINDVIVAVADPRVPFGGRRSSGFGTTQGAEGLLEMTAPKTISTRRGSGTWHLDATGDAHQSLFGNLIRVLYANGLRARWQALRDLVGAGRAILR